MVKGSDEVEARRKARAKIAKLNQARRERDERVEGHLTDAAMSAAQVDKARENLSQAEQALRAEIEKHEARMARIVAAFRGEEIGVDSIAELLDVTPKQVRAWNRAAGRQAFPGRGDTTTQPSLTEEQDGRHDA